ncbi:MAG: hypothetical protein K2M34_00795 [Alphaproteobacteria bacterium]|nr:hypothetical protein [Alphaproteobacteria bacterium]
MQDTKSIIKETRDTVNELLQEPGNNPMEKLQYKVMFANLSTLLYIVNLIQNMRQPKKTR